MITIWIVEDDKDWLRGLHAYLASFTEFEVAFIASTVDEVRKQLTCVKTPPQVVLMDIMLDDKPDGITLAEEVVLQLQASVIMLTSMEQKELIFRSFQAGAVDYQMKSDFEALPDLIRRAANQKAPISASVAEQLRKEFRRLRELESEFEAKKLRDQITSTELELLRLIDQGYTQSEIADQLVISIRTVKNHINNILKKLKLHSSKEAAQLVREKGLFDEN